MLKIKPQAGAKSLWDINDNLASETLLYNKQDDIPLPWDAAIWVEGDKVVLEGSIFGADFNKYTNAGFCRCEISVEKFSNAYELELPSEYDTEEWIAVLEDSGWVKI